VTRSAAPLVLFALTAAGRPAWAQSGAVHLGAGQVGGTGVLGGRCGAQRFAWSLDGASGSGRHARRALPRDPSRATDLDRDRSRPKVRSFSGSRRCGGRPSGLVPTSARTWRRGARSAGRCGKSGPEGPRS
jgi:hypothetical protein